MIRKVGTAERKAQIRAQYGAFNKYLIFKLTTTYVPGDGPDAKQVDDLEGFTRVQYLNKDDLILEEGEDDYTIFPKMDILKDISIMGDYHSQNYSNMKAYTKLELKADFYEIQKQALNKTNFWLEGITNMTTSTVSKYNCSAALARAPTYHEERTDTLLTNFRGQFQTIDAAFLRKYREYEAEIAEMVGKEKANAYN